MTQFYKVDCTPTVQDVEKSIEENGGLLQSFGYGFAQPGDHPDSIGDWKLSLVDKRGMGNHGSVVAIATTPETYKFQEKCTRELFRRIADNVHAKTPRFVEESKGDIGTLVVPLFLSPINFRHSNRKNFIFKDEKWAYYAHPNGNYLRVGDDRYRIWVRKVPRYWEHDE